jgi:molecular chaperone GrpE
MAKDDHKKVEDEQIEQAEAVEVETIDDELEAAIAEDATEAENKINALTADLQRAQADFVNYKRRAEAEKAEMLSFAKSKVVRDFLSVRDTFDSEHAHRPETVDAKWAASIDSIRAQFDSVLKGLGVERFESVGHVFDPHLHNAVAMEEDEGAYEVVTDELQGGYKLGDQILRHAMVRVGHTDVIPAEA